MIITASDAVSFIAKETRIELPPLVPELKGHFASEITPIWQATEAYLDAAGVAPPFWAFPWAGGQAMARYILDHPALVRGQRVLDFGAGSGLIAIAAARAGAASVRAVDIDSVAVIAMQLNAELNGVAIETEAADVIGTDPGADVILVGDMCYEAPLTERMLAWLRGLAKEGTVVLIGDPGRTYLPKTGLEPLATYVVPTSRELEDRTQRETTVWCLAG